jgi:hypoxanthine phosphoribosyltransferase
MEKINVLYDNDTVVNRIKELAKQINNDYQGKEIRVIGILRGGVYFMTELTKYIEVPVTIDFMAASSYGNGTVSSGKVNITKELDESIEGCDVLVVEDIIDTGRTLDALFDILKNRNPKSLKLCTLLDKPARRVEGVSVKSDYNGFSIPDLFVVGCGLDYAQKYRNLSYIGEVVLD